MIQPDRTALFELFFSPIQIPSCEPVAADGVPAPYHQLLVHTEHMTETMEAFYGERVAVQVLDVRQTPEWYARKILLRKLSDGRAVQFGLVRIRFRFCTEEVVQQILEQKTPLGRVLIEHNVMRRIEPREYFRVPAQPILLDWFGPSAKGHATYGRMGVIFCDEQPAIEVIEICAPNN
jgi:chorismate-pyruvate lyase